jgi:hypothetical protein
VTSRITATTSAAHLDPDEIGGKIVATDHVAANAELDAARFSAARGFRQRRKIRRTVGDMDAIEQAVTGEPRDGCSEQGFRRGRNELHGPVRAMTRNHVAHVERE